MMKTLQDKLRSVVEEHPRLLQDTRALEGMLRDHFPQRNRDVHLLASAHRLGVVSGIQKAAHFDRVVRDQLVRLMVEAYGTGEHAAVETVCTWAFALGHEVTGLDSIAAGTEQPIHSGRTAVSPADNQMTVWLQQVLWTEVRAARAAGCDARFLREGIGKAHAAALEALWKHRRDVKEPEAIEALLARWLDDVPLAELLAEAVVMASEPEGIHIEKSFKTQGSVARTRGIMIDRGYLSPHLLPVPQQEVATLRHPWILVTDQVIRDIRDILPVLEEIVPTGKPLLIIADDAGEVFLETLLMNKKNDVLQSMVIKAPGFGDRRKAMLADIACMCGAEVISMDLGRALSDTRLSMLGRAGVIEICKESTRIVEGEGDPQVIQARKHQIRTQISETRSEFDREKLQERLQKMEQGVVSVRIGAHSLESIEAKIAQTKAVLPHIFEALESGVVPEVPLTLLRLRSDLSELGEKSVGAIHEGVELYLRALEAPARMWAAQQGIEVSELASRAAASPDGWPMDRPVPEPLLQVVRQLNQAVEGMEVDG